MLREAKEPSGEGGNVVRPEDISTILGARPRRTGRVFVAALLLVFDVGALLIWGLWLLDFLRGSDGLMTINDVAVPVAFALPLGPLALASLFAVWLMSDLRGYHVVLGIAIVWLAYAALECAFVSFTLWQLLVSHAVIVALLISGRPAFRR